MNFMTINAEQQAFKYITTFRKHDISLRAAFFEFEGTSYAESHQRIKLKKYIQQELTDPKARIFQFCNGDIFILSEVMTNNHVCKIARHFDLYKENSNRLFKLPHSYSDVAEILAGYMKAHVGDVPTLRDKLIDLKVSDHIQSVLHKIGKERSDNNTMTSLQASWSKRLWE